jgi:hypothetical protein
VAPDPPVPVPVPADGIADASIGRTAVVVGVGNTADGVGEADDKVTGALTEYVV